MIPTIRKKSLLARKLTIEMEEIRLEKLRLKNEHAARQGEYAEFVKLFKEIYGDDAYKDIDEQVKTIMSKKGLEK